MQRRTKILIIVVAGILLFAIGAGWYWYNSEGESIDFFNPLTRQPVEIEEPVVTDNTPVSTPEPEQFSPAVVARLFTERFGTFSNEDDFAGIELVRPYMTSTFTTWFDTGYKSQLREKYAEVDYAGETVKVLGVQMESESNERAVANVRTQRTVRTTSGDLVTYQTLQLEMIKNGGLWLVDGAYWLGR